MSTATAPYPFRRRTIGRASSPPTWACYEQIPYDDDECSDSDSCSEDGEDYGQVAPESDSESEQAVNTSEKQDDMAHDMEIDDEGGNGDADKKVADFQKDVKGKQRAIEPEPEKPQRRHRKKQRQSVYTLRPILTIQRSQGFVWNQDLFVPPYIKDRYVASTSPPNSKGFISTSASSTNSALIDYEVEVVEIRVQEGELDSIIP